MRKFMLNNLGEDWIYEASDEKGAVIAYLSELLDFKSVKINSTVDTFDVLLERYAEYCAEIGKQDLALNFKEVL